MKLHITNFAGHCPDDKVAFTKLIFSTRSRFVDAYVARALNAPSTEIIDKVLAVAKTEERAIDATFASVTLDIVNVLQFEKTTVAASDATT